MVIFSVCDNWVQQFYFFQIYNQKSMRTDNLKYGLVLFALLVASTYLSFNDFQKEPLHEFESWKIKYNIKFNSEFENAYREKIFLEKKAAIELHNSNPARTYNKGINHFSAMTEEEFRATYLTLQSDAPVRSRSQAQSQVDIELTAGDIDWRTMGAVTAVKDQGHCGSCWSFSSTGGLEGLCKISTGVLRSFSEQQMIDCVTLNNGCHGGQMRRALLYVKDNGIVEESDYPYTAAQGPACLKPKGDFKLSGYTNITGCNELANALTKQPIMVGIDSDHWSDYQSGIFNGCVKQRGEFNHGVLVVGVTKDYWIIKNQWTSGWGENGFMRLEKGDTCNVCDDGMLLIK